MQRGWSQTLFSSAQCQDRRQWGQTEKQRVPSQSTSGVHKKKESFYLQPIIQSFPVPITKQLDCIRLKWGFNTPKWHNSDSRKAVTFQNTTLSPFTVHLLNTSKKHGIQLVKKDTWMTTKKLHEDLIHTHRKKRKKKRRNCRGRTNTVRELHKQNILTAQHRTLLGPHLVLPLMLRSAPNTSGTQELGILDLCFSSTHLCWLIKHKCLTNKAWKNSPPLACKRTVGRPDAKTSSCCTDPIRAIINLL